MDDGYSDVLFVEFELPCKLPDAICIYSFSREKGAGDKNIFVRILWVKK